MSKLIKLSDTHYVGLGDGTTKKGEWYCINRQGISCYDGHFTLGIDCEKITHSSKPLEPNPHSGNKIFNKIEPLSLSEVEEAIYGYSVEKMADEYSDFERESKWGNIVRNAYKAGFNARKELVKDKLFTVDDLRKAIDMARTLKEGSNEFEVENILGSSDGTYGIKQKYSENQIIESLLPKTEWRVEFDEQGKIVLL